METGKKYTTLMPREKESLEERQGLSVKKPTDRSSPNVLDDCYDWWDLGPFVPDITCYEPELHFSGLFDHNGRGLYYTPNRIGFLP